MAKGAKSKITQDMEGPILAHAAKGWSSRRLAALCAKKWGVTISHVAIGNFIRETKRDRGDVAGAVVRAELGDKLPKDLRVFDRRLLALVKDLKGVEGAIKAMRTQYPLDPSTWLDLTEQRNKMLELLRRCLDTKLHYVGADGKQDAVDGMADFFALGFDD